MCSLLSSVSEEDKHLPSPFTQAPTASMIFEKEKQTKERAIPPGLSKLRKYREKHEPPTDQVMCTVYVLFDQKSVKSLHYFYTKDLYRFLRVH